MEFMIFADRLYEQEIRDMEILCAGGNGRLVWM
jgi:hypothetical protein